MIELAGTSTTAVHSCLTTQGWPKWVLSMVTVQTTSDLNRRDDNGTSGRRSKILITGWGPFNVTIPAWGGGIDEHTNATTTIDAGGLLSVDTDYPFGDTAVIRTENVTRPFTLSLRIPGWASGATLSVYSPITNGNGRRKKMEPHASVRTPHVVPCINGTYHDVEISAGSTVLSLDFRPQIRVSYGWGPAGTNAVAVMRGSLLYALPLEEHYVVTGAPP